jgi:transketolase
MSTSLDLLPAPHALSSRIHARALVEYGTAHPEALVLSADLTASTEADDFQTAFPERFITCGMAEQNMLGVAGGLAREGYEPLVHDFAVFLYRRALDQLQMSVAYPALRVRLLGFLPGLTTPGGVTHQAIDDLAVLTALPGMTVVECGDAGEVASVLEVVRDVPGPVYIRMLRGELPHLFAGPMRLGRSRLLREGSDVLLLSTGACTPEALAAAEAAVADGVSVAHRHVSTLKPFDDGELLDAIASASAVVTVENHLRRGGLGTAVAEAMAERGAAGRLHRVGIDDTYARGGTAAHLFAAYGIDRTAIHRTLLVATGAQPSDVSLAASAARPRHTGAEEDL